MTGTDLCVKNINQSRSYLNNLVFHTPMFDVNCSFNLTSVPVIYFFIFLLFILLFFCN